MRIIAFDTETTGVNVREDRIIDLCMMELHEDLEVFSEQTWRFDPGIPIPPEATAVHDIRDEDVVGKPPFKQHAARVQRVLQDATLVAFNGVRFDVPLLHYELVRAGHAGISPTHPVIDPYLLYLTDCPRTLQAAAREYGVPEFLGHDAARDTAAMIAVLRRQVEQRGVPATALLHQPERRWLDHGHHFYEDGEGAIRFGFGRHQDAIAHCHRSYLEWMLRSDFPSDIKVIARRLIAEELERA